MRTIWRSPSLLLAAAILLTLGACGVAAPDEPVEAPEVSEVEFDVEAPEADDEPLEDLMVEGPRLVATGGGTLLSEGPDLAPETLEDGATVPVYAGIHLQIAEDASADLGWPAVADDPSSDFATGQLLAGTRFNIEASDPEIRSVALVQDTGTARFKLLESEAAADLSLRAGSVNIHANEPSDFILSYHPAEAAEDTDAGTSEEEAEAAAEASADEEASDSDAIETDDDEDSDGDPPAEDGIFWVVVVDGSVIVSTLDALPADGEDSDAVDEDNASADDEAADADTEDEPASRSIAAGQAAAYTTAGDLILALAVNEAGVENWYQGVAQGKWGGALTELPEVDTEDGESLAGAVAAAIPSSATFTSDDPEIQLGDCTMLRWSVSGALFVDLDNINVADRGSKEVCPEKSWTYTLHWAGEADSLDHYAYVGIVVYDPSAAPGQEREKPPEVQPIATMCIDGVCFIPGSKDDPRLKSNQPTTEPTPIPTLKPLDTLPPPPPRNTKVPPTGTPTSAPPTETPPPPTGTPTPEPTQAPPSETPEPGTSTATPEPLTPTVEPTEEPTADPLTPTAEPTEEPTPEPPTPEPTATPI